MLNLGRGKLNMKRILVLALATLAATNADAQGLF
jgi:hypothetical protein